MTILLWKGEYDWAHYCITVAAVSPGINSNLSQSQVICAGVTQILCHLEFSYHLENVLPSEILLIRVRFWGCSNTNIKIMDW